MLQCFICYRRRRPWAARSIYKQLLVHQFDVFFDIDTVEAGDKFPDVITNRLARSHVVFVTIDDEWLVEKDGRRPLNDPQDWVRREIEFALNLKIPIIPLLIGDAKMPNAEDLPASLRGLTEFRGVQLHNEEFESDFDKVLRELRRRAEAQVEAQESILRLREYWDRGDWLQIYQQLAEAVASWGGGRHLPSKISQRLAIARELVRAADAISQGHFAAAVQILESVPIDEVPRNVRYSIKLARTGARVTVALDTGQIEVLEAIGNEYANSKREALAAGLDIVPGLSEVGAALDRAQTTIRRRGPVQSEGSGSAPPTIPPLDPIDCSVFAPDSVRGGDRFLIHVYLHKSEDAPASLAVATKVEPSLATDIETGEARQVTVSLETPLRREAKVDIFLEPDGLVVDKDAGNHLAVTWRGMAVGDQFVLRVPRLSFRRTFFPVVRLFAKGAPVGRVRLKILRAMFRAPYARSVTGRMQPYKKAFLSYSSADRIEVLKRAQALRAASIEVFQDVLSLDPGDRWARKLFTHIGESDLFLLFWSRAARNSKWVLKEVRYAMRCKRRSSIPEIIPVILDGPAFVKPPRWLSHLHFADPICYLLAAETTNRAQS